MFDSDGRAIAALALSVGTLEYSMERLITKLLPPRRATARAISDAPSSDGRK